jgi:hypothetical protein
MTDAQATATVVRLQLKVLQEELSNAGLSAMKVDVCPIINNACIGQAFSEYYR